MKALLSRTQDALRARAAHPRTVHEIRKLPLYPGDAERIAHRTVYGR